MINIFTKLRTKGILQRVLLLVAFGRTTDTSCGRLKPTKKISPKEMNSHGKKRSVFLGGEFLIL